MNRRLIFGVLLVAFIWIVLTRLVQIENVLITLSRGRPEWVFLAILLQVCFYLAFAAIYQTAFLSVGLRKPGLLHLIPLTFAAVFLNVVAPSGGASGIALFVDDAARRGESPARAAAAVLVKVLSDFLAIALILTAGMTYLLSRGNAQSYQITGLLVFLAILSTMVGALALGIWKPLVLCRLLLAVQKLIDGISLRLRRRPALAANWAERSADELQQASQSILAHPGWGIRTVLFALISHTMNMLSLYALFRAFHAAVMPGPLIAGYAMAYLFLIISIIPMGIGVVEGVMALVFTSLGVPGAVSTIVALSFRGMSFWLPFLLGFFVLHRLKTFKA